MDFYLLRVIYNNLHKYKQSLDIFLKISFLNLINVYKEINSVLIEVLDI